MLALDHSGFLNLKLKLKLFTTDQCAQIELPKLSGEAERGPPLIEIDDELKSYGSPKIRERDVSPNRLQLYFCVEWEKLTIVDEAVERVAVEVITVGWVAGPIRVRVMRRDDRDARAGFRNSIKLSHQRHHIGNVFKHVAANNLIEFIVRERIRNNAEIVNHIGMSLGI